MSASIEEMAIEQAKNGILRLQLMLSNRSCATCDHHGVPYGDCPWSPDQGMGSPPAPICHKYDNWNYKKPIEAQIRHLEEQLSSFEKPLTYSNLCTEMAAATTYEEYQELARRFRAISDYQDAKAKANECDRLVEPLIYSKLCKEMYIATTLDKFCNLAKQFREISTYKDATEKADECERLAEPLRYNKLCQEMNTATSASSYRNIAMQFREISSYKDSKVKANECEHLAKSLIYDILCKEMDVETSASSYRNIATQFREISDYRDSKEKADECECLATDKDDEYQHKKMEEERTAGKRIIASRVTTSLLSLIFVGILINIIISFIAFETETINAGSRNGLILIGLTILISFFLTNGKNNIGSLIISCVIWGIVAAIIVYGSMIVYNSRGGEWGEYNLYSLTTVAGFIPLAISIIKLIAIRISKT